MVHCSSTLLNLKKIQQNYSVLVQWFTQNKTEAFTHTITTIGFFRMSGKKDRVKVTTQVYKIMAKLSRE